MSQRTYELSDCEEEMSIVIKVQENHFKDGTLVLAQYISFVYYQHLLAQPSDALVVSQFQDPSSLPARPTFRFGVP